MHATLISYLAAIVVVGQASQSPTPKTELEYQQQCFKQWWGQELNLTLADLPTEGKVPEYRIPYSGFDYPDRAGGTIQAMAKYDQAFHNGRMLATEWERRDVDVHKSGRDSGDRPIFRRGLFGRIRVASRGPQTPYWYGHCNGWTAAAIRHAEPQFSVTRNGVVFTPADIKGMLAEIYMYTETEFLGGQDAVIHPALLHLMLTNWLGRGSHPIGMESAVGQVVINYPIYSYKAKVTPVSDRRVEVSVTTTYAMNTNRETNETTRYNRQGYYHYLLDLDENGKIAGGRYYTDSHQIDMLWAPLKPIQGGKKGNERGNPHVNVDEVLAIWRASVPEDIRNKWLNIDPTEVDRIQMEETQLAENEIKPSDKPEKKENKPEAVTASTGGDNPAAGDSAASTGDATTAP